jgi:hypothetical protein
MKKNILINEKELEIKKHKFYELIGFLVTLAIISWLALLI